MFYGACFNESFGFDIGKIVVKEDTPELDGGFKLEKFEALKTTYDQGTQYIQNRLDEKSLNLKVAGVLQ